MVKVATNKLGLARWILPQCNCGHRDKWHLIDDRGDLADCMATSDSGVDCLCRKYGKKRKKKLND